MQRVYLWDNLKFFSIICILILHSTTPYAIDGMSWLSPLLPFINLYPMTLFAIISGFWFKERSIKKLAIIFLLPCLMFTVVNGILGIYSHFPDYLEKFMFKPGYAMWYLLALFLFSVITKYLLKKVGVTTCLLIALGFAIFIGFLPIPNRYCDIQRISRLFPSFAFGVWLNGFVCNNTFTLPSIDKLKFGRVNISFRLSCVFVLVLMLLFNVACYYFSSEIRRYDNFVDYYGLDVKAACIKWLLYAVRIVACTCVIFLMPNKKYWFTRLGSRTMNVYLLHMIVVFSLSWGVLYNFRYDWYGLLSYFLLIPLLCTLFFSIHVDRFMKMVLLSKYIKIVEK